MAPRPALPPLNAVVGLRNVLDAAGAPCALGGSGLLAALGLTGAVRDWDLTTDAPPELIAPLVAGLSHDVIGPSTTYATAAMYRIRAAGREIDLMSRFAIRHAQGVFCVPTRRTSEWMGLPVGCPIAWCAAYWLIGRLEKAETLLNYLDRHGAEPLALNAVLSQPMPQALRDRLTRLARSAR